MLISLLAVALFLAGRAWFDAVERRHSRYELSTPRLSKEIRQDLDRKFPSLTREP